MVCVRLQYVYDQNVRNATDQATCLDLTPQIYVDYISGVAYFLGHRLKMGKQYAKYYLQEKIAELHMCNIYTKHYFWGIDWLWVCELSFEQKR